MARGAPRSRAGGRPRVDRPPDTSAGTSVSAGGPRPGDGTTAGRRGWAGLVPLLPILSLVLAAGLAYHNTLQVPFLFDDDDSITNNPSIYHLWPLGRALNPPSTGAGVAGRPLVNLSLALNHAWGGFQVEGYHLFNLTIHLLSGLLLYGLVRRTLLAPVFGGAYAAKARGVGWLTALLWLVHPLLTESVTCVIQRTESLLGLFYLATLYASVRAMTAERPRGWMVAAFFLCLAGMATKEVMVSAPLLILLYDRTFVTGSFAAAWRRRQGFYFALLTTWGLLGWLVLRGGGTRGGTCGFNTSVTWWQYLFTSFEAICRYLKLSVWPHPLVMDYGTYVARNPAVIIPCGLLVVGLGLATVQALWRRPVWGFIGAWFFVLLAPSSSFLPLATQTMAEHRMYLPLIAPVLLFTLGLQHWFGRRALLVGAGCALLLTALTVVRNHDYRSVVAIWEDNAAKWPQNARAYLNLGGRLLNEEGERDQAIVYLAKAVALSPDAPWAHFNLGSALGSVPGREAEAAGYYRQAITLQPGFALAHLQLGALLSRLPGREQEGLEHVRTALELDPHSLPILIGVGAFLAKSPRRRAAAVPYLQEALQLDPDSVEAHANLGVAWTEDPAHLAEALAHLEKAARLQPERAAIYNDLAVVLAKMPGRLPEAIQAWQRAVHLRPAYWEARYNLGMNLLELPGRESEAITQLEEVTRLKPDYADAQTNLGLALAAQPARLAEAVPHFEAALKARPDSADVHFNLATALAQLPGRNAEARPLFEEALRLNPQDAEAHLALGRLSTAEENGHTDAEAHFQAALRQNPQLAEAHLAIVRLLASNPTRKSELKGHLEATLKLEPENAEAKGWWERLNMGDRPPPPPSAKP